MPKPIQYYLTNDYVKYPVLKKDEFERMDCRIFGLMPKARSIVPAIIKRAGELGYKPHWMTKQFFEDAGAVSNISCTIAKHIYEEGSPFKAPCVIFFTGEMLVSVGSNKGSIGGRNQEFCMHAAVAIEGNKRIVVGSVDTDGTDGPGGKFNEDAWKLGCNNLTGGVVDGYTLGVARRMGIDFPALLRRHDNSDALWQVNSGVWATQNISVNDIILLLVMDHDG
jgi:glycerate-2-kinase